MIDEILLWRGDEETMKALTMGLGAEERRERRQKGSGQEPALIAGKCIGRWEVRNVFLQSSNGYKIRII